ncbi:MAG: hypothetical protein AAGB04_31895, partial [Pseudomonadota bacterium]
TYNAQNALMLERKEDMKKRGIPSPDVADAFALTFAYPVMGCLWEGDEMVDDDWGRGRNPTTGY